MGAGCTFASVTWNRFTRMSRWSDRRDCPTSFRRIEVPRINDGSTVVRAGRVCDAKLMRGTLAWIVAVWTLQGCGGIATNSTAEEDSHPVDAGDGATPSYDAGALLLN